MNGIFTDEALQQKFNEEGYVILDLLSDNHLETLRKLFFENIPDYKNEDLYESSRNRPDEVNDLLNNRMQEIFKLALHPYSGDNPIFGGTFLVKPAYSKNFLPLHQDWSIVEEDRYQTAFVWCPLQETNSDNGGLFVVPGSHTFFNNRKSGSLPSPRVNFNEVIRSHTINLTLKPGQAIIYSDNLFHGSEPNPSDNPRVIATARIVEKGAPLTYYQKQDDDKIGVYYFTKDNYLNGIKYLTKGEVPPGVKPAYFEDDHNQVINESTFTAKLTGQNIETQRPERSQQQQSMSNPVINFFKTYTPANIVREIYYRLQSKDDHAQKVGEFYDRHHLDFMEVYGDLIQAFRTTDIKKILDYEFESIGLEDGMTVLDAGCGVCRPAIHFSQKANLHIKAISISKSQIEHASSLIASSSANQIELFNEDYHQIDKVFHSGTFDRVYFLESFGHSTQKKRLLQSVWNVLKSGGSVYIKDLFARKTGNKADQKVIYEEINKINNQYHYQVAELSEILDTAREIGFVIEFAKTIDIQLEDFENLTISNKFQELTGIYKIESFENYIFPVDFIELKLYKPAFNIEEGKDRYFLQNLLLQNQSK